MSARNEKDLHTPKSMQLFFFCRKLFEKLFFVFVSKLAFILIVYEKKIWANTKRFKKEEDENNSEGLCLCIYVCILVCFVVTCTGKWYLDVWGRMCSLWFDFHFVFRRGKWIKLKSIFMKRNAFWLNMMLYIWNGRLDNLMLESDV